MPANVIKNEFKIGFIFSFISLKTCFIKAIFNKFDMKIILVVLRSYLFIIRLKLFLPP